MKRDVYVEKAGIDHFGTLLCIIVSDNKICVREISLNGKWLDDVRSITVSIYDCNNKEWEGSYYGGSDIPKEIEELSSFAQEKFISRQHSLLDAIPLDIVKIIEDEYPNMIKEAIEEGKKQGLVGCIVNYSICEVR